MREAISWMEGVVSFFTGGATAVVAYAQDMDVSIMRGWNNRQNVNGRYIDRLTGQRADVNIAAMYTYDTTILRLFDQEPTAVFMTINHSALSVSAGYRFSNGVIQSVSLEGAEGGAYRFSVQYYANTWTAWGSAS